MTPWMVDVIPIIGALVAGDGDGEAAEAGDFDGSGAYSWAEFYTKLVSLQ